MEDPAEKVDVGVVDWLFGEEITINLSKSKHQPELSKTKSDTAGGGDMCFGLTDYSINCTRLLSSSGSRACPSYTVCGVSWTMQFIEGNRRATSIITLPCDPPTSTMVPVRGKFSKREGLAPTEPIERANLCPREGVSAKIVHMLFSLLLPWASTNP